MTFKIFLKLFCFLTAVKLCQTIKTLSNPPQTFWTESVLVLKKSKTKAAPYPLELRPVPPVVDYPKVWHLPPWKGEAQAALKVRTLIFVWIKVPMNWWGNQVRFCTQKTSSASCSKSFLPSWLSEVMMHLKKKYLSSKFNLWETDWKWEIFLRVLLVVPDLEVYLALVHVRGEVVSDLGVDLKDVLANIFFYKIMGNKRGCWIFRSLTWPWHTAAAESKTSVGRSIFLKMFVVICRSPLFDRACLTGRLWVSRDGFLFPLGPWLP